MNALYLSILKFEPPAPFCNFLILLSAHSVSRLCVWTSKKWVVQIFFSFQSCNSLQMSSMQDLTHDVMKKMTLMLSLALFLYHHTRIITPSHSLQLVWASCILLIIKKESFGIFKPTHQMSKLKIWGLIFHARART